MTVTPEFAIEDLKSYLNVQSILISQEALDIFKDFEQMCSNYDVYPFGKDLLIPLINYSQKLQDILCKYGCKKKLALECLFDCLKDDSRDGYNSAKILYSSNIDERDSETRTSLIDQCIKAALSQRRRIIRDTDIIQALLNDHDLSDPPYSNVEWSDERLHTRFNTLSHICARYCKDLWIKFEDVRFELKDNNEKTYDLVISFAGEDRHIAKIIADEVRSLGFHVFYDDYEKTNLWGKDLYTHLSMIYGNKAKFCLMIISKDYARKQWANLERRAAQERAFRENREYILPLRLDDTLIPGLLSTIGYIDYRITSIEEVVDLIHKKLLSSSVKV